MPWEAEHEKWFSCTSCIPKKSFPGRYLEISQTDTPKINWFNADVSNFTWHIEHLMLWKESVKSSIELLLMYSAWHHCLARSNIVIKRIISPMAAIAYLHILRTLVIFPRKLFYSNKSDLTVLRTRVSICFRLKIVILNYSRKSTQWNVRFLEFCM